MQGGGLDGVSQKAVQEEKTMLAQASSVPTRPTRPRMDSRGDWTGPDSGLGKFLGVDTWLGISSG